MTRQRQGAAANTRPSARELAEAMRGGLEGRRLVWAAPGDELAPPVELDLRGQLLPYANLLYHSPGSRARGGASFVRLVRRVLRVFLKPWLDLQTRFNEASSEALQRSYAALSAHQAELTRRLNDAQAALRALEQSFGGRINECFRDLYQEREARQALAARLDGAGDGPADCVRLPAAAAGPSEHVLEQVFVHTRLPAPPARLLELACGDTARAVELSSLGFQVTGLDLAALPPAAAAPELPFPDESFDVVTALSSLAGAGPPEGEADLHAVAEVARVLRPGGRLLLTLPYGRAGAGRRAYDAAGLEALLGPLAVVERTFAVRRGARWAFTADEPAAAAAGAGPGVAALALVVAERP